MPKRSVAMAIAMALFAGLAFSPRSEAGSVTTVTAVNASGMAADDFEATFIGTGGSVHAITVLFSSGVGTTTQVIDSGAGTRINFNTPLPDLGSGVLVYRFLTNFGPLTLNTAVWTFKNHAPIDAKATTTVISIPMIPEPASMSLMGIGMASLFAFRRYFRRTTKIGL